MIFLLLQVSPPSVTSDQATGWTAMGIVVALFLWLIGYAGPKVINAVETIAPTIAAQMKVQEESHAQAREKTEARHSEERAELLGMVRQLNNDRHGIKSGEGHRHAG